MTATIINSYGEEFDFEATVQMMDDEVRESVHEDMAPCSEQEFFDEYCKRHEAKFGEPFIFDERHPQV